VFAQHVKAPTVVELKFLDNLAMENRIGETGNGIFNFRDNKRRA
jgi:hypothetical protein